MPRLTPVERKKATRMLQANVTLSVMTKHVQSHVRTIGRLRNLFDKLGQRQTVRVYDVTVL